MSGDTYRLLADFLYDETLLCSSSDINSFSVSKIDAGRKHPLVFVSSWKLEGFVQDVLPSVKVPFVLVTHQGDVNIKGAFHKKIADNPMVLHWFAQNSVLKSDKVTCLPIGLEDAWRHNAGTVRDFKNKRLINHSKKPKILFGFSLATNPESRAPCFMALAKNKNAEQIFLQPCGHIYRKTLSRFMFVASPAGNGLDCHRTWEAIYFGVVPIVEDNAMNRYFKSLSLPVVLINPKNWAELKEWTEESMTALYNKTISSSSKDAAFLPFWIKKFDEYLK